MNLVKREVTENEINNKKIPNGYEKVNSINVLDPKQNFNVKLLIVGTITPPDGAGYYYTSKINRIYGYLDEASNKTTLKAAKEQLRSSRTDEEKNDAITEIKKQLNSIGVAFIDIAKTVIRKNNSSSDDDIKHIVLDYDAFKGIENINNIICNSNDALECFNKITENKYKPIMLSQRRDTKIKWINTLIKCLK